jgi:hypothetical protein
LVWKLDESAFKEAISGYNKGNFELVMADFPAIESAKLKMTPPWVRSIPDDPDKITVEQIIGAQAE